jgi:NADPH-dependent ferric siderophore reductase
MKHQTSRVRFDSRKRTLNVLSKLHITPRMLRIVAGGDDLADFTSLSADDHFKLFVPGKSGELESRDFTPRRFDADSRQLTIDFALHQAGPAIEWAKEAKIGDSLTIGGPRGSFVVPDDFDWWLLIGDETALPSIGRRVEELSKGTRAITLVAVTDRAEEQVFNTKADHQALWAYRSPHEVTHPEPLLSVLSEIQLPPGDGYVWIAAEVNVARAVKKHMINNVRHPLHWLRATGYWVKGKADTYEKLEIDGR